MLPYVFGCVWLLTLMPVAVLPYVFGCVWLLTLMPVAVLLYVFVVDINVRWLCCLMCLVVDINAGGCVAFCVWLLTLMPMAVLPCVFGC